MKKVLTLSLTLFILLPAFSQQSRRIVLLHTNDMHSRVIGYSPESAYTPLTINDDKTVAGLARIATVIREEREANKDLTLVVDAGDFLMGTLFQELEPSTGFQLRLMKKIGYDVVCLGNHEFDFGDEKLASILSSAAAGGKIPPVLLGNGQFSKEDPRDDGLEKLSLDGILTQTYIMESGGLKIGFFSLMGKVADDNAAYARPLRFSNQIKSAKKLVSTLKDQKCDVIICLSHSGVDSDKKGGWKGEDVKLAGKVKGIDVVVSGHTHTKLDKPLIVNGVPVIQAGEYGQYVGKLVLKLENGKISVDDYSLIPIDDRIKGDEEVCSIIEDQKKLLEDKVLKPIGMDYISPVAESDFLLECNESGDIQGSNLGPLVADAIQSYLNNHAKGGVDVSMVAVGVIRDKIVPGVQSAPDIFRIMSMGEGKDGVPGYPLSRIFITGKELKSTLEILQMASKSVPANYCYYSGLKAEFNPKGGLLNKIRKIEITGKDGIARNVSFSKKDKTLYSVAANSYMLEFVGIIKKMSFGLINVVPKDASGAPIKDMKSAIIDVDESRSGTQEGKEWLAIMEYLSSMKDKNGNGIPDIEDKYRSAVKTFFPTGKRK